MIIVDCRFLHQLADVTSIILLVAFHCASTTLPPADGAIFADAAGVDDIDGDKSYAFILAAVLTPRQEVAVIGRCL